MFYGIINGYKFKFEPLSLTVPNSSSCFSLWIWGLLNLKIKLIPYDPNKLYKSFHAFQFLAIFTRLMGYKFLLFPLLFK